MSHAVTIYDIAKMVGTSPSTVSKAINGRNDVSESMRTKVLLAATELGYRPNEHARGLKTKKSWLVGIVYGAEDADTLEHPLFLPILNAFKERMEQFGYELLFLSQNFRIEGDSLLSHVFKRQVDGLLFMNVSEHVVKSIVQSPTNIPMVSCDASVRSMTSVVTDNVAAGIYAVEYLYERGHRLIGHIAGPELHVAQSGTERLEGYMQGLKRCGLPFREQFVVTANGWTPGDGMHASSVLFEQEQVPTAVFCAADFFVMGLRAYCLQNELVIPDDVSVIGFDDVQWTDYVEPGFTTFRQDKRKIGMLAADELKSRIDGNSVHQIIRIPAELIERSSVCTRELEYNDGGEV